MTRFLSKQQTDFIKDHFFEFGFAGKEPDKEPFEKIETSAQLHYLADIYNWDDGAEVLDWIVSSSFCDKGTALLIFWRAEPDYYTKFENESEADTDKEIYLLLQEIIANWQSGFYTKEQFRFDPTEEGYDVDYRYPNEKWKIPNEMKRATKGGRIYGIDDIRNRLTKGFKVWWVRQKLSLRGKKRKRRK